MRHGFVLLMLLVLAVSAFAYPGSCPSGYAYDPPLERTCRNCHGTYPLNSGSGTLSISGLTEYTPGESYTIHIDQSDAVDRSGFQATVKGSDNNFAGSVYVIDAVNTQMTGGYINHTYSGNHSGNAWDIGWTAPAAGTGDVLFCVSTAACNNNGGTSGDYCYGIQVTISEAVADPYGLTTTAINDVVPASGGNVTYSIDFFTNVPQAFAGVSYWTTITLPNGTETSTQFYLQTNIPANADIYVPLMTQAIPAFAPAGSYTHHAHLGYFPFVVLMDDFAFTKSAAGTDGIPVDDYAAWGEWPEIAGESEVVADLPSEYRLNAAYPNPFNAMTTISVTLPEASDLSLTVFNVMGEQVASLNDGQIAAGTHSFSFNAADLSSGVYFVHANVLGQWNRMQKVTLVK